MYKTVTNIGTHHAEKRCIDKQILEHTVLKRDAFMQTSDIRI
jgi:hypothetical protein